MALRLGLSAIVLRDPARLSLDAESAAQQCLDERRSQDEVR